MFTLFPPSTVYVVVLVCCVAKLQMWLPPWGVTSDRDGGTLCAAGYCAIGFLFLLTPNRKRQCEDQAGSNARKLE